MKYQRINTPNRLAPPPFTALEEVELAPGLFGRVVIVRGAADPRSLAENQAHVENLVSVTKKAVQIDADGNLVMQPNGLASGTRTTSETVDLTGIGDTHSWRAGWVRLVVPAGENWRPDNLPERCKVADALPDKAEAGVRLYVDPSVYEWSDGLIASMVDSKADELLRVIQNSAQLAGVEF